jgi:hypothetical protein
VRLDLRAIALGAALAVAVAAAAIVAVQLIDAAVGLDRDSNLLLLFYAVLLGGFVAGGRLAASRRPDAPLAHGALAAVVAYVVLIGVISVVRLAGGRAAPDPVAVVFNGLMSASVGILGGFLAARRTASRA